MFDNMGNEGLHHGHKNTQELPCLPEASTSASYAAWGTLEHFKQYHIPQISQHSE